MKVLVLGYSSFARRRIIPVLRAMPAVSAIAVASRSSTEVEAGMQWYTDYAQAITQFKPDIVYVSLINSLHGQWVKQALEQDCHVVVDKPAFLSLPETQEMVALAESRQRCLAEAVVYEYHAQIRVIKELMREKNATLKTLVAQFSFPPFAAGNFRNEAQCGGGAVNDLGAYALSLGRIFFGNAALNLQCCLTETDAANNVDTAFTLSADYGDGRGYAGVFGFNTQYRNRVTFLCDHLAIDVDRFFTTPPDVRNALSITQGMDSHSVEIAEDDSVRGFFNAYFSALAHAQHGEFHQRLLQDAVQVDAVRKSINQQLVAKTVK